eukprot:scaffold100881_cov28-Tisochrysis_lutea.AAC.9
MLATSADQLDGLPPSVIPSAGGSMRSWVRSSCSACPTCSGDEAGASCTCRQDQDAAWPSGIMRTPPTNSDRSITARVGMLSYPMRKRPL